MSTAPQSAGIDLQLPEVLEPVFYDDRYTVFWGGRDGTKTWGIARALVGMAHNTKERILCTREFQASIKDSVHKVISDQIELLGLTQWFEITDKEIRGLARGSEFIFKGLHNNYLEIKGTEGVTRCWVEEAQKVSRGSWTVLIPTVFRNKGSRILVSFNPQEENDDTYRRFVPVCEICLKVFEDSDIAYDHHKEFPDHAMRLPPPGARVIKTSWRDNVWTSPEIEAEREHLKRVDPEGYAHVYEGECMTISEAVIFKGKYYVHEFDTPWDPPPRFFHGGDFGFASSPACLIRSYVTDEPAMPDPRDSSRQLPAGKHLWVDQEAYGYGVEQDDLPTLYEQIPTSRGWPIKADAARPETISHVKGKGFNISAAEKWKGSIEDGIHFLKQFVIIHIHSRCKNMEVEARMYRHKVDKNQIDPRTNQPLVLPIIIDAWNHGWDSLRYAFDGYIKSQGSGSAWSHSSGWLT